MLQAAIAVLSGLGRVLSSRAGSVAASYALSEISNRMGSVGTPSGGNVPTGANMEIIRNIGGNMATVTIDASRKEEILAALRNVSANATANGISEGELLQCLAHGRSDFAPFSMFCRVYGGMMNIIGSTIPSILGLAGLLFIAKYVEEKGPTLWERFNKFREENPWLFWGAAALAGGGVLATLMKDEENKKTESGMKLNSQTLKGFFTMFVPSFVSGAFETLFSTDGELFNDEDGRSPSPEAQVAVMRALRGDELSADELRAISDDLNINYDDVVAAHDEE